MNRSVLENVLVNKISSIEYILQATNTCETDIEWWTITKPIENKNHYIRSSDFEFISLLNTFEKEIKEWSKNKDIKMKIDKLHKKVVFYRP